MQIYITKGVQQIGPFTEQEIRGQLECGEVKDSDLAWCEGCSDWVPLAKILPFETVSIPPQPPGDSPSISDNSCKAGHDHQRFPEDVVTNIRNGPPPLPLWPSNHVEPIFSHESREADQSDQVLTSSNTPERSYLAAPSRKPRSILWMTVWAFLWPGMGQVLCGQRKKGVVIIISGFFMLILTAWTGIIPLMIAAASAIDAFKVAKKIANGKIVGEWEFFPDETH
jgi:hypothetical protein